MKNLNYLGIDFGLRKIGLAIANSTISTPYTVLKNNYINQLFLICKKENIDKIIIGVSEGKMAEETKKFANKLKKEINLPIEFYDETLSTQDAIRLSLEAGIKKSKRKSLEDAMAASVMLQNYIDSQ